MRGRPKYCLQCKQELIGWQKRKNTFCNMKCAAQYKSNLAFKAYFLNDLELKSTLTGWAIRSTLLKLREYRCERCGNKLWLNKPITLEVHHIDGDANNNKLNNLELLCPNCHSMTDNFKSKNKGSGRRKYRNASIV